MVKTSFVLAGLACLCTAKVDWFGICDLSGDIPDFCADLGRGETYQCLADEYKKEEESGLTMDCKEAIYERGQEAYEMAKEEEAARAAAQAATTVDWFGLCEEDIGNICADMQRQETFKCLAEEYRKGDEEGQLTDVCASAILARSNVAAAASPKDQWKAACIGDIAQLCGDHDTSDNGGKISCLAEVRDDISDYCYESLALLQQVLQSESSETSGPAPPATEGPPVMGGAAASAATVDPVAVVEKPSGPVSAPAGFAAIETAPKGKAGKGKGGKGKGGKGKGGKGKGGKAPVCPMMTSFTAGACKKKVRVGFGLNSENKCMPIMGCANQKKEARKLKFFKNKMQCNRMSKKC